MEREVGVRDRLNDYCSKRYVGLIWRFIERDELIKIKSFKYIVRYYLVMWKKEIMLFVWYK